MLERKLIIQNETGIHARPAGKIVKEACKYRSTITFKKGEASFNAKSIINLMSMAAAKGDEVVLIANGEDEEVAIKNMSQLILNNLE
ncbi:HPr family phosphocarrier protein [Clostridium rectalis]|uniref:HPr family phosphocarrier protein n=1 Tax=Clostridium rectalis TaxID=2040295 RepID=UPI000F63398C|nr:HPr family phosphocarrier protein [Clostridium rectalis]